VWSNTTRSLFGVPPNQSVTYELFLSLLEPTDRVRTERAITKVAENGGRFDVSMQVRGAGGRNQ
jgi:two-component system, LuxR family, sensor kinase FixL